ncbi:hypothetical protein [Flavihumibacter sp. UBA7668]|uniref:hypothetical protein n=1 Tax=Flavihumibacter sp. UBA7668 TaxID=1946542 RepID=UPI0025C6E1C4|nr:hypothetical protein [Flavihumibacter sp. UBA7668]
MQKLNESEMASFQGGYSDVDCGITAALTVVGTAIGIAGVIATGGSALAFAGVGLGYVKGLYSTLKSCRII